MFCTPPSPENWSSPFSLQNADCEVNSRGPSRQSRCSSAAPHTLLFYPMHFKCLVEARLCLPHRLCDAKELNNVPKTPDSRAQSKRGSVLQVMQPKAKRVPKATHTHFGVPFLEILPLILLGKKMLGSSAQLRCKPAVEIPQLKEV